MDECSVHQFDDEEGICQICGFVDESFSLVSGYDASSREGQSGSYHALQSSPQTLSYDTRVLTSWTQGLPAFQKSPVDKALTSICRRLNISKAWQNVVENMLKAYDGTWFCATCGDPNRSKHRKCQSCNCPFVNEGKASQGPHIEGKRVSSSSLAGKGDNFQVNIGSKTRQETINQQRKQSQVKNLGNDSGICSDNAGTRHRVIKIKGQHRQDCLVAAIAWITVPALHRRLLADIADQCGLPLADIKKKIKNLRAARLKISESSSSLAVLDSDKQYQDGIATMNESIIGGSKSGRIGGIHRSHHVVTSRSNVPDKKRKYKKRRQNTWDNVGAWIDKVFSVVQYRLFPKLAATLQPMEDVSSLDMDFHHRRLYRALLQPCLKTQTRQLLAFADANMSLSGLSYERIIASCASIVLKANSIPHQLEWIAKEIFCRVETMQSHIRTILISLLSLVQALPPWLAPSSPLPQNKAKQGQANVTCIEDREENEEHPTEKEDYETDDAAKPKTLKDSLRMLNKSLYLIIPNLQMLLDIFATMVDLVANPGRPSEHLLTALRISHPSSSYSSSLIPRDHVQELQVFQRVANLTSQANTIVARQFADHDMCMNAASSASSTSSSSLSLSSSSEQIVAKRLLQSFDSDEQRRKRLKLRHIKEDMPICTSSPGKCQTSQQETKYMQDYKQHSLQTHLKKSSIDDASASVPVQGPELDKKVTELVQESVDEYKSQEQVDKFFQQPLTDLTEHEAQAYIRSESEVKQWQKMKFLMRCNALDHSKLGTLSVEQMTQVLFGIGYIDSYDPEQVQQYIKQLEDDDEDQLSLSPSGPARKVSPRRTVLCCSTTDSCGICKSPLSKSRRLILDNDMHRSETQIDPNSALATALMVMFELDFDYIQTSQSLFE